MLERDLMASVAVLLLLVYVGISLWFFSNTVRDKRLKEYFKIHSKSDWEDKCWVMGVWWIFFVFFVKYSRWDMHRNSKQNA